MVKIDIMPDICMVNIISRLPIIDILQSAKVCHRWKFCQEVVRENITSVNVRGEDNFDTEDYTRLQFYNLKDVDFDFVVSGNEKKSNIFWKKLVENFPNIEKLAIYKCSISEKQLTDILTSKLSQNLTHLKIIPSEDSEVDYSFIWPIINDFPALNNFSVGSIVNSKSIPPNIEEFFCSFDDFPDDVISVLKRLSTQELSKNSVKLKKFGIVITDISEEFVEEDDLQQAFDRFYNQNLCFANMLTRITLTENAIDLTTLKLICSKFPSISYFDFLLDHPNLFDEPVWKSLAQLKSLTDLSIRADENYQQPVVPVVIDSNKFPLFESITKSVRLSNCNRIHPHQYSSIEAMFPHSQSITIQFNPRYFVDDDPRYRRLKLCHLCSNCVKLRRMIPDRSSGRVYESILIYLAIKHGLIQNVEVQFEV